MPRWWRQADPRSVAESASVRDESEEEETTKEAGHEVTGTESITKAELKEAKQRIDLELKQAELELKKHELTKAAAEAEKASLEAEQKGFAVADYRRQERKRQATEPQELVYMFSEEVSEYSVGMFAEWLENRRLRFPGKPVTVYVNSPGGSVFAGFVAMDAIREAEESGTEVTVKVTGMAASMAGVIAQAASKRLIGKSSELMLHTVAAFQFGHYKTFEIDDQNEFAKRLTKKSLQAYADRSEKWDVDALFKKVHEGRKDWWLSAEEAVEEGFMDGTF